MNDSELESRLKSVPVPERSDEYWNDFPANVRMELYRKRVKYAPQRERSPRLAWAGGFAIALSLVFVCLEFHPLKTTSVAITKHEKHIRAQIEQLDSSLHVLMFNPHDMGSELSEPN